MKKEKRNLIISIILILFTITNVLLAKNCKSFFFSFYPEISVGLIKILTAITSFCSFSLWEVISVFIAIYFIIQLFKGFKSGKLFLSITKIFLVIIILISSFINIWGLNYYAPLLSERLHFDKEQYSIEQLAQLTDYLVEQCNYYSDLVERDENNRMITHFDKYNSELEDGFASLKTSLPFFKNVKVPVKKLLSSKLFSEVGTTGIFICLTGESSITNEVYNVAIPFTMVHEVAHRNSIAREDEANFIAFMACKDHKDIEFRYSAYYLAFMYSASELINKSEVAYQPIREKINDHLCFDILDENDFYEERTDKEKEESNNELYNSYLESFGIEEGVESYGEMVQLLLQWYYTKN